MNVVITISLVSRVWTVNISFGLVNISFVLVNISFGLVYISFRLVNILFQLDIVACYIC